MDESKKIFRLPGTIEEDEEKELENILPTTPENPSFAPSNPRIDSPLLSQRSFATISSLPRNITLVRVNTQSSGLGGLVRQDSTRSRYRAGPARKLRRRAVLKNGECNVLQSRISQRSLRFLQDIFTTLVDTQWRWTLLCFSLSFVLSWLGFAVIWWLIAFTHGDFEERHLPPFQVENNWTPCIYNIFSFTSCFLFSIETQHTIGYGSRSTSEECPEAIFVMCIQSIAGVMIQAFMVGIVFAKMSRPKQRTQTLLFSRHAVICQRDGELCLMFRVGDMRKSHIIGATVRAQMIRTKTTKEGEILSQNQQELAVGTDGKNGNLFFIWPMTIVHKIDEDSPFYDMSAEDMLTERFEVVVILEGTIESTGQTTQARSSYLPQEILWGHRFEPVVSYSKERQGYEVDYSLFDGTTQVDTPLCSARELAEFYKVREELRHGNGLVTAEDTSTDRSLERYTHCQCGCRYHRRIVTPTRRRNRLFAYVDDTRSDDGPILPSPSREMDRFEIPCVNLTSNREKDSENSSNTRDVSLEGSKTIHQAVNRHLQNSTSPGIAKNIFRFTMPDENSKSQEGNGRSSNDLRKCLALTLNENEIRIENEKNRRGQNSTEDKSYRIRPKRSISTLRSPSEFSRSFVYDLSPESGFYEADRFDSSPENDRLYPRPNSDLVDDREYREYVQIRDVERQDVSSPSADEIVNNSLNDVFIADQGKEPSDIVTKRTIPQTNV